MRARYSLGLAMVVAIAGCGRVPKVAPKSAKAVAWKRHDSPEGRFTVEMPGPAQSSEKHHATFTSHKLNCFRGDTLYTVTYFDPPAGAEPPEVTMSRLRQLRDQVVKSVDGKLVSEMPMSGPGYVGHEVVIEDATRRFTARSFAVGERIYTIEVAHEKRLNRRDEIDRFFLSFDVKMPAAQAAGRGERAETSDGAKVLAGTTWAVEDASGSNDSQTFEFGEDGDLKFRSRQKLTGKYFTNLATRVTVRGDAVEFGFHNNSVIWRGTIDGDRMEGTAVNSQDTTWNWTATKVK